MAATYCCHLLSWKVVACHYDSTQCPNWRLRENLVPVIWLFCEAGLLWRHWKKTVCINTGRVEPSPEQKHVKWMRFFDLFGPQLPRLVFVVQFLPALRPSSELKKTFQWKVKHLQGTLLLRSLLCWPHGGTWGQGIGWQVRSLVFSVWCSPGVFSFIFPQSKKELRRRFELNRL